ncbi:hypothetical protein BT69DRAFT_1329904 [Atractiella rhizophila]|nr:hypothetical protein BT69DRAFT_1329904 [Atractiella rhizophila]
MKTVDNYGIDQHLGCITGDGASNNTTAIEGIESHVVYRSAQKNGEQSDGVSSVARGSDKEDQGWRGELPFDDEKDIDVQVGIVKDTLAELRSIVKHVRLTPQRRKTWFTLLEDTLNELGKLSEEEHKILILDCCTRWSSTHDRLALCLQYREAIERYVDQYGLERQRLKKAEWDGIEVVTTWLESFHNATLEMSTTSTPSLSSTLGMDYGLMGELRVHCNYAGNHSNGISGWFGEGSYKTEHLQRILGSISLPSLFSTLASTITSSQAQYSMNTGM